MVFLLVLFTYYDRCIYMIHEFLEDVEGRTIKRVVLDDEYYHKKIRFTLDDDSVFVVELDEDEVGDESMPYLWHYFERD